MTQPKFKKRFTDEVKAPIDRHDVRRVTELLISRVITTEDLNILGNDEKGIQKMGYNLGMTAINILIGVEAAFDVVAKYESDRDEEVPDGSN